MKRLATALAALAGALLLFLMPDARPAAAHHEWFTAGADYRRYPGPSLFPHTRSWVVQKWRTASSALTWNSDTGNFGSGALDVAVRAMLVHAQSTMAGGEFAQLDWQEVPLSTDADVEFRWLSHLDIIAFCGSGAGGCYRPFHGTGPVSPENAYYLQGGIIVFDMNEQYSSNGLRAAVMHEIMHVYGLADDYSEDALNPSPGSGLSIMGVSVSGPSNAYGAGSACPWPHISCIQGAHSNVPWTVNVVPTASDVDRLRAFWRFQNPSGTPHWNGTAAPVNPTLGAGGIVNFVWHDYAWSELYVAMHLLEDTGGGTWTYRDGFGTFTDVGRHSYYDAPANHNHPGVLSAAGHAPGSFKVCGLVVSHAVVPAGEIAPPYCTPPFNVP